MFWGFYKNNDSKTRFHGRVVRRLATIPTFFGPKCLNLYPDAVIPPLWIPSGETSPLILPVGFLFHFSLI